eukprot:2670333-Rhodomonas_salina.2
MAVNVRLCCVRPQGCGPLTRSPNSFLNLCLEHGADSGTIRRGCADAHKVQGSSLEIEILAIGRGYGTYRGCVVRGSGRLVNLTWKTGH